MNKVAYLGKYEIKFISSPEKSKSVEELNLHLNKVNLGILQIDESVFNEIKNNKGKEVVFLGNEFKVSKSILSKLEVLKNIIIYRNIILCTSAELSELIDVPRRQLRCWLEPLVNAGLIKYYNGGNGMEHGYSKILVHPALFFKVHPDTHVSRLKSAIEEFQSCKDYNGTP